MIQKKEMIAMLLAGGQGSRLYTLTREIAKPAVPFGGKYRIIDFPLSNCVNSGVDTVGVLTQYQPLVLNEYIGNGQPWDLDRNYGGVYVLPPLSDQLRFGLVPRHANAIYQNLPFIKRYDPDYVLILSGDHIYKMDYSKMLSYHKEKGADCTIAVLDVPLEEASRFGIMNADEDQRIFEFEEKPRHPKSTLASMGIYIFTWEKLEKYLTEDAMDPESSNDFGKNIIPRMLAADEKMYAYAFDGYWKDVGTIDSLWEANMDLLNPNVPLELYDPDWKIYARNPVMPPQYFGPDSVVQNSMVTEGCVIDGIVDFSVIFAGVTIEKGAIVRDSIVMPGSVIKADATVEYSIIAENVVIGEKASVGRRPEGVADKESWGIAVVGNNVTIGEHVVVPAKAMVDRSIEPDTDGEVQAR